MTIKLFHSHMHALEQLHKGFVTNQDLENGLFALTSEKNFVLNKYRSMDWLGISIERQIENNARFVQAIKMAEKDNRVIWTERSFSISLMNINDLLVYNGFKKVDRPYNLRGFKETKEAVEASNQGIEVVYK